MPLIQMLVGPSGDRILAGAIAGMLVWIVTEYAGDPADLTMMTLGAWVLGSLIGARIPAAYRAWIWGAFALVGGYFGYGFIDEPVGDVVASAVPVGALVGWGRGALSRSVRFRIPAVVAAVVVAAVAMFGASCTPRDGLPVWDATQAGYNAAAIAALDYADGPYSDPATDIGIATAVARTGPVVRQISCALEGAADPTAKATTTCPGRIPGATTASQAEAVLTWGMPVVEAATSELTIYLLDKAARDAAKESTR